MNGRKRLTPALKMSRAGAANTDLFDGTPWRPVSAKKARPVLRVVHSADFAEVLSITEDLWMRIARNSGLCLQVVNSGAYCPEGQNVLLLIRGISGEASSHAQELLSAAQNLSRYRWQPQDSHGRKDHRPLCLVQDISWRSNTLVIELVGRSYLERHMGSNGAWQVQALVDRVKAAVKATGRLSDTATEDFDPPRNPLQKAVQFAVEQGSAYWQEQMRAIKRSMDAGRI